MVSGLAMLVPLASSGGAYDTGAVIMHHVSDSDWGVFGLTKAVLLMVLAAILVLFGVARAVRGYDEQGVPATRWAQMLDPFVEHFYRDVAVAHVGEKWAPRVTPLLLNFFFFILTCNLLGLLPLWDLVGFVARPLLGHDHFFVTKVVEGSSTATGNVWVTMALAAVTFFAIIVYGARAHGFAGHFAHLAPPGVIWPVRFLLLVPIETLSMFVKPFALTMRLAANMTAGHMGILAILSLPFILHSVAVGVPSTLLAVGIMMLEIIVCFVQAYVFALLSGVFIGMALHPHH